MKVTINQVAFLREAINSINISAKDARDIVGIQDLLDKEFLRLQKNQEKQESVK